MVTEICSWLNTEFRSELQANISVRRSEKRGRFSAIESGYRQFAAENYSDCTMRRTMKTRLTLKAGEKGTGKLTAQYGDRLLCVRYRHDEKRKKRFRTIELIIEKKDWEPKVAEKAVHERTTLIACVRVKWGEKDLARKLREAGGRWDRNRQLWIIPHEKVSELGIDPERVVGVIST